jgi:hypothetical protein
MCWWLGCRDDDSYFATVRGAVIVVLAPGSLLDMHVICVRRGPKIWKVLIASSQSVIWADAAEGFLGPQDAIATVS